MTFRKAIPAMLAMASSCAVAWAVPAIGQEAQLIEPLRYSGLDKMPVALAAVRYENVATNRPSVIIYVSVKNSSGAPLLFTSNTFAGTTLSTGSSEYSDSGYTFPSGYNVLGAFETKTLAVNATVLVAFRYQLAGSPPVAPLMLNLQQNSPIKLLGQRGTFKGTLNVPGYIAAPPTSPKLTTPPQLNLSAGGHQTIRVPDASFHQTGPLRMRADQIQYGHSAAGGANPEYIEVSATVQNTLSVPVLVRSSSLNGTVITEGRPNTRSDSVKLFKDGIVATDLRLNPGEWAYLTATHSFYNEAALRAARRAALTYAPTDQAGGTFAIDLPPLTKKTGAKPEATKQAALDSPALTAGTSDFRKTAYMDVKLDGITRRKAGGVEVTLSVRNKVGRRLGVQHDWQDYTILGSDGVEYRNDGNHYGKSGNEPLASTIWLENEEQAQRTWLFPRFPYGVTPQRLIIREYGKEKASIDLPK